MTRAIHLLMSGPQDAEEAVKPEGGLRFIFHEVEYSMWERVAGPCRKKG